MPNRSRSLESNWNPLLAVPCNQCEAVSSRLLLIGVDSQRMACQLYRESSQLLTSEQFPCCSVQPGPVDRESERSLIQTGFFQCGVSDTRGTWTACSLSRPALREQDAQVAARERRVVNNKQSQLLLTRTASFPSWEKTKSPYTKVAEVSPGEGWGIDYGWTRGIRRCVQWQAPAKQQELKQGCVGVRAGSEQEN